MIDAAAAGKIKAMYVVGENIASAGAHVTDALGKLDFLVVQDLFLTETAAKANVVLPSASFAERDGTVTNAERRVQRIRKAIEPVGTSKADWQITCDIAKAMGHEKDFAFKDAEAIFNEIAKAVPAYAGITYAELEKPEAIQWPAAGGVFGTAFLYADKFSTKDGKAAFAAVEYKAVRGSRCRVPVHGRRTVAHGHALRRTPPPSCASGPAATVADQQGRCKGTGHHQRRRGQSHRQGRQREFCSRGHRRHQEGCRLDARDLRGCGCQNREIHGGN